MSIENQYSKTLFYILSNIYPEIQSVKNKEKLI